MFSISHASDLETTISEQLGIGQQIFIDPNHQENQGFHFGFRPTGDFGGISQGILDPSSLKLRRAMQTKYHVLPA